MALPLEDTSDHIVSLSCLLLLQDALLLPSGLPRDRTAYLGSSCLQQWSARVGFSGRRQDIHSVRWTRKALLIQLSRPREVRSGGQQCIVAMMANRAWRARTQFLSTFSQATHYGTTGVSLPLALVCPDKSGKPCTAPSIVICRSFCSLMWIFMISDASSLF